ncbi:glycosyltransferase family 2 protein [Cellulomonas cellasea]|uniref:glycosyltransferase family 2 protein n=1 Tax=Cellulomonas cellasea TaxID=43670 RepID=UPI0025A320BA|nr:glycosyltransferase family 2 protein [Cellulomonas cellasea]MDM8083252.1 glycosyltransferase family 2 protein [Cellulomonas cellasea]
MTGLLPGPDASAAPASSPAAGAVIDTLHVVVLSWHGREDTLRCVASVLADGLAPHQVLVVDNGSGDGLEQALRAFDARVRFEQTGANLGFTGGMNHGIRACLARGAGLVCVLNNDTQVTPGMFAALVRHAAPGTAVSPEVRYLDEPEAVWFGGGVVEADRGWPRHLTPAELARDDAADPTRVLRESQTLAGCCVLAPAETWRAVGLFDPQYFLLFEDADWSARARAHGIRLAVARDAVLLHAVSASFTGPGRLLSSYYYARNAMRFTRLRVTRRPAPRLRFIRDQLARPTARRIRSGEVRGGVWEALFTAAGLAADALRRYGPAPGPVLRWARRAATPPPAPPAPDDGTRTP